MGHYIDIPACPSDWQSLGHYEARATGKGQAERYAIEDAVQNAVDQIMLFVPWVYCRGGCEPVFEVDVEPLTGVLPRHVGINDWRAVVNLKVHVKVRCVSDEIGPGGHIVLKRHDFLPPRPGEGD